VYDDSVFNSLIDQIMDCFATARFKDTATSPSVLMSLLMKQKTRCRHLTAQALLQNRSLLFLNHMQVAEVSDRVITFFVRRCIYMTFFRPQPIICQTVSHSSLNAVADMLPSLPMSPLFLSKSSPMNDLSEEQSSQDNSHALFMNRLQEPAVTTPAVNTDEREMLEMNCATESAAESERPQIETKQTIAAQLAAEQKRIRREVKQQTIEVQATEIAKQQRQLQREAEARAAAERAEQERLKREAQQRLQREAETRAAAERAEREQLQREAERAAAEQERERLEKDAEWRATAKLAAEQEKERLQREAELGVERREVAELAARRERERQQREAAARLQMEVRVASATELAQAQKEADERAAQAAEKVHAELEVERAAQQAFQQKAAEKMIRRVKETEDLLAAQTAELKRLRKEAAERAAQEVERALSQEADEREMEQNQRQDHNDGIDEAFTDVDIENLDKMLQNDAEQAASDYDTQDRALCEAERAAAELAEQEHLLKEA
jgi:hypothetical protein